MMAVEGQNVLETKWVSGQEREFLKMHVIEIKRVDHFLRGYGNKKGEHKNETIPQNVYENKRDINLTLVKFSTRPECYRKINHLSLRGQNVTESKGERRQPQGREKGKHLMGREIGLTLFK
jgi:hypothetical protein